MLTIFRGVGYQEDIRAKLEARNARILHSGDIDCVLMRILNRHDPIGIVFESNLDEYHWIVEGILGRLPQAESEDQARRIVHEEFVADFAAEMVGEESDYAGVAHDVWAAWQAAILDG